MSFVTVEGSTPIRSEPPAFFGAFARRIAAGLFPNSHPSRIRYVVTRESAEALAFRAASPWTAAAIGLNEVDLAPSAGGRVRYRVRYARWAGYVVVFSAVLGLVFIGVLLALDVREYIAGHATSRVPGLSLDQNVAVAWAMATFWGFVWPWILIALYRRPLRRQTERLIAEVDAEAAGGAPRG